MNTAFYKKVIDLIPSADLKYCVLQSGFRFKERDLLRIILRYAPTFDKKRKLFEEAARLSNDGSIRALAKKRIAFENKQYDAFMLSTPDTVYEIEIKIAPDAADEDTYLTDTFDEAILLIRRFIKCYAIKANELVGARYTIKKKTTNVPTKPHDIYKGRVGTLGKCVLDNAFRIIDLNMYDFGVETTCKSGVLCDECNRCIESVETQFPHFLQQYDLIAYYDDLLYNPNHITYAVFDLDMEACDNDSHVIDLEENAYIRNRNADFRDEKGYFRIYDAHAHPLYFEIIKPNTESVPQNVLEDYTYAVSILKKIETETEKQNGVIA